MAGTIPIYQRKVNTQDVPNVRVQDNAPNLGAGAFKALGNVAEEQVKRERERQNKIDIQKVLDTSTAIDNDLMNAFFTKDTGYFDQKGTNAVGVAQNANKFMADTLKKYEDSLDNDNQRLVFKQHMIPKVESYNKMALAHENQQLDIATDQSMSDQMNSAILGVVALRNNPEAAMIQLNAGLQTQDLYFNKKGLTEESKKLQRANFISAAITKAVETDLDENNIEGAQKTLASFGDKLDPISKGNLEAKIRPLIQTNEVYKIVDSIKKDPNMLNPDGTLNLEKVQAAVEVKYGQGATKTVKNKFVADDALIKQWITGNTENVNPVFLTRLAQLAKDNNQQVNINDGFRTYDQQAVLYENSDKSGKMVAPPGRSRHEASYATDVSSEWVKNLSNDQLAKYGLHKPMSYENWHIEPIETNGKGTEELKSYKLEGGETTQTVSAFDPIMYKKVMDGIHSAAAEMQAIRSQNTKQSMDAFDNYLVANKPTTVSEIEAAAKQYGFTGADLINAIGKGKQVAGLMKLEENQASDDAYKQALQDIHDGKIASKADLGIKYGGSVQIDKLISLENFLDATHNKDSRIPSELQNKDNWAAFDGVVSEMDIKDKLEKSKILEKVTIQVKNAKANGESVSRADIEQWTREQATKVTLVKRPWYRANTEGIVGDVPAGWTIDSEGIMDTNGVRPDKYENGKFYITRNGQDYLMPGQ